MTLPATPAPDPRAAGSRRHGFTLIELLVVVAILGVLLALLLPALKSVRLSGYTAKCVSNQKAVTTAYLAYISDNRGMLWYRSSQSGDPAGWANGSGAMFGPQTYAGAPGYLCYLLKNYGLTMATWSSYTTITDRYKTAWYCPATAGQSSITGHGCTYYYQNLGQYIGVKTNASLVAVSSYISTNPYLWDYYGDHSNPNNLYATTNDHKVYSYLDGHSEYR